MKTVAPFSVSFGKASRLGVIRGTLTRFVDLELSLGNFLLTAPP